MVLVPWVDALDTSEARKARGAFFTPAPIARFITDWAVRHPADRILEPSCGEAAFLTCAVEVLRARGATSPEVVGVEIHPPSAAAAGEAVARVGGVPRIVVSDFFDVAPDPSFQAVIGNPPYVRYQDWAGSTRSRSRAAALRAGVGLTQLASSWAAFAIHSALFLQRGGRLGLVLPAELLSVNYAAPVRDFLLRSFARVELVLFMERVFPEAETEVVLLLAEGFDQGPTDHATVYQVRNADALGELGSPRRWQPHQPEAKWEPDPVSRTRSLC